MSSKRAPRLLLFFASPRYFPDFWPNYSHYLVSAGRAFPIGAGGDYARLRKPTCADVTAEGSPLRKKARDEERCARLEEGAVDFRRQLRERQSRKRGMCTRHRAGTSDSFAPVARVRCRGGTRLCSTQVREGEYNLTIRPDTSNHRYRVWFYFSVRNCYAGQCIVLTITNFSKTKSTYRDGMTVPEYLCGARLSGSLEVPLGALSVVRHRPGRSQRNPRPCWYRRMRAVRTHAVVQPVVSSTSRPKWQRMPTKSVWYYKNPKNPSSYAVPRSAPALCPPAPPQPTHSLNASRTVQPTCASGAAER
jgi:hypothetical protein